MHTHTSAASSHTHTHARTHLQHAHTHIHTNTHKHTHTQVVATDPAEVLEDITVPKRESDISAWVNVIYGCNEKCSYCVVPYTRCVRADWLS